MSLQRLVSPWLRSSQVQLSNRRAQAADQDVGNQPDKRKIACRHCWHCRLQRFAKVDWIQILGTFFTWSHFIKLIILILLSHYQALSKWLNHVEPPFRGATVSRLVSQVSPPSPVQVASERWSLTTLFRGNWPSLWRGRQWVVSWKQLSYSCNQCKVYDMYV